MMLQWRFHPGRTGHPDWYSADGLAGHYEIMPKTLKGCEQDLHPKKGHRRWTLYLTPQYTGYRTAWSNLTVAEAKAIAQNHEAGHVLGSL